MQRSVQQPPGRRSATQRIATDDGGVIGKSGITYDQNGIATGQTATLPTYSWNGNAYQQQGSVQQVSDDLLFYLFDLASSFWPTVGGNYSDSETGYALVRTFQGNVVNADVFVTSPSQTNPNQQTITNVLNNILQALNSDPHGTCSAWLTGTSSSSVSVYISTGLLENQHYGHGVFNDVRTSAISGQQNKDGTLIGVPGNYAFTVNDQGAFFNARWGNKNLTVNPRNYKGGTLQAQAAILIHEIAHQMNPGGAPPASNLMLVTSRQDVITIRLSTQIVVS
jgi:hypothetical protein